MCGCDVFNPHQSQTMRFVDRTPVPALRLSRYSRNGFHSFSTQVFLHGRAGEGVVSEFIYDGVVFRYIALGDGCEFE